MSFMRCVAQVIVKVGALLTMSQTVDGLGYSFSTLAISIACLYVGEFVADLLPAFPTNFEQRHPGSSSCEPSPQSEKHAQAQGQRRSVRKLAAQRLPGQRRQRQFSQSPWLDSLTILSAVLSYLVAILLYFLAPGVWRHRAVFPILLSPPGAMLRFFLARFNAGRPFPLGTFTANMIASVILGGVFAEQHRLASGATCNALHAIQEGFCGCLSTVSTFAVEVRTVRKWWKVVYIFSSVILGHLLVLATVGGVGWDKGLGPICSE